MKRIKSISFLLVLAFVAATGINAKVETELNLAIEPDPVLNIEAWMSQDDYWTSNAVANTQEVDGELDIEEWMFDNRYWK